MAWGQSNTVMGSLGFEAPYGYSYGQPPGGLYYKSRRTKSPGGAMQNYVPGRNPAHSRRSMRRRRFY